jgi:DNA-directed RNA polymerase subunit M/transcription elongation factor TFIIS
MDKIKGSVKAKKKTSVKVKRQEISEEDEYCHERFLGDVAKKLIGVDVDLKVLSSILKNLQIDMNKDFSDDDLFLIYNLLSEPLIINQNEKNIFCPNMDEIGDYQKKMEEVSEKFVDVLPNQRILGIYHNLPSLETHRLNFEIEKDIFRNKPLLGKGIFKCGKCGSDDTEDYEKQTRSADEPMTVFVHCRKCNAYFRFG